MTAERTPRRLGRGLDALLGDRTGVRQQQKAASATPDDISPAVANSTELRQVSITTIKPNQYQPRKQFSSAELSELTASISSSGLLQPIVVRVAATGNGYELVAGERRLRAVTSLGWTTIPAIVREYDDRTMLTFALIENLQREDLNPIEEAEGYARLVIEFSLTQNEIATLVGKDRSTIANLQRVLQLPPEVRAMLQSGVLTLGHARPLLALENPPLAIRIATEAVEQGLSVRAIEERVRREAPRHTTPQRGRPRKQDTRPAEVRHVEDILRKRFQTDASLVTRKDGKGELRLHFYSTEDLNRLLEAMGALE